MTASSKSVQRIAKRERAADDRARAKVAKSAGKSTADSFQNFAMKLGLGTDNASSGSGYGFNPITRNRTMLEWIHRGTWLGGIAVDLVADDMTRAGVDLHAELEPAEMQKIEEGAVSLGIWNRINENIKWGRLYGGSIAVIMIDGQDMTTELRLNTVGKGQFKGLFVLDRWMIEPSLNKLVTKLGPDLGMPMFYDVVGGAPALTGARIHHTRCIRAEGVQLPYWQRLTENLWSISVIERIYDRMVAFDSATAGAAQLVYKAFLRTLSIPDLRQIVAAGGDALNGLAAQISIMSRFQGIEGITLIDAEDKLEMSHHGAFQGLAQILGQFGEQLSGALQIPLVRLFGQAPGGLNSDGDSELRTYYDNINQQQEKTLRVGVTRVYRALAQSEGVKLPEGTRVAFRSLWQLSDNEKADIAEKTTRAVTQAEESGLITPQVGARELKQSSTVTGIFSNITEEDIEAASDELPPTGEELMKQQAKLGLGNPGAGGTEEETDPAKKKAAPVRDAIADPAAAMKYLHDLDVVIENKKGSIRTGVENGVQWSAELPTDYGYIRRTIGDDGDQVDCFIGPQRESTRVWIIRQQHPVTHEHDEDKCMLGYTAMAAAVRDYVAAYTDGLGWERIGDVLEMPMADFKAWLGTKAPA